MHSIYERAHERATGVPNSIGTYPFRICADIGKAGGETLTRSWTGIRYIEIAGREDYSPLDIANAFAAAVGHTIEAIAVPRAE